MADTSPMQYNWRDPKNSFGAALSSPYFGSQLSSSVQQAGGAQSPFQQSQPKPASAPAPSGGFNVPGTSGAGFGSANFNPGSPTTPPPVANPQTPKPASFGQALQQNPFAQPLIQSASQSILGDLNNNQPSMGSMVALNEYNKGETEALRQAKEASALNGRAFTGQMGGDVGQYVSQQLIPQRQNFLGQLQGNEEQFQQQRKNAAMGNLATLAGLGQQGEQAQQQLAFNQQSLAQAKDLANRGMDIQQMQVQLQQQGMNQQNAQYYAGLAQANTLASRGMDLQQVQLELQKQGMSQQDAQYYAGLASQQSIAGQQIAAQAQQNDLNRTLQKYIADQGFSMDQQKLSTQVQQFNSQMDFQKWATQAGIDQQNAQRIWQANQNDVQRKFEQGQQLSAQENNILLEKMRQDHDTSMAQLQHTLNLDTLDKQQQFQQLMQDNQNTFQSYMADKGFSYQEALQKSQQDFQAQLQKEGYSHDDAVLASQQMFQAQEHAKDLDQAKTLAEAQMAQQNSQFMADMQQKYAFKQADLDLAKTQLDQHASEFAQQMGLSQAQFAEVKNTQDFQNLKDVTSTLMSMAGDNPTMQQNAAETFLKGLANMKDANGNPLMSQDKLNQGLLNIQASSFKDPASFTTWAQGQQNPDGTPKYTADQIAQAKSAVPNTTASSKPTPDTVSSAQDIIKKSAVTSDPNYGQTLAQWANQNATLSTTDITKVDKDFGMQVENAAKALEAGGVPSDTVDKMFNRKNVSEGTGTTNNRVWTSRPLADYTLFYDMTHDKQMNPQDAANALIGLIGKDRAKAALTIDPKSQTLIGNSMEDLANSVAWMNQPGAFQNFI